MSSEWWQRAAPVLQSRREVEQTRMAIAKHKARGHDTEGLHQLLAYLERQLAAVEAETRLRKTVQCPTCSSTTDAAMERCLWCRQSLAPSDSVMLGGSGVEIGLEAYRKLMEGEKE